MPAVNEKKNFIAQLRWCVQSNYLGKTRTGLLAVKSEQLIADQICEFCCCYDLFSDGNKTSISCRPSRSVIIRMITKSISLSRVWLQNELNDTKSCCQLFIKITISEKRENSQVMKKRENLH